MRKIILFVLVCLVARDASGQGLNDGYFGMFDDTDNPVIDCNTGLRDVMVAQRCMTRDFIDNDKNSSHGTDLTTYSYTKPDNTQGLYGKVARLAAAAAPKKKGTTTVSANNTRRVGSYNYNTSDSHIEWMRNRQAQIQAEREEPAIKEMQRKIADNNRAAAVTAQTNARLQGQTNARIQRDHWHATQGAVVVRERAQRAVMRVNPQFDKMKPQSTGSQQAARLRNPNKPRRIMQRSIPRQNTIRQQLPPVQRKRPTMTPERAAMLKKALMVRAELRRYNAAQQRLKQYKGFVLDPHAVPTTGQDHYVPLNTPRIPDRQPIKTSDYYDELLPDVNS